MNAVTRDALEKVASILHEAGWDSETSDVDQETPADDAIGQLPQTHVNLREDKAKME
ncbi:MAG: hypothetical protein L0Y72_24945 [Gemmataceae bacterium]|nr:hypothetical protein [Gemmataceae bacterium]